MTKLYYVVYRTGGTLNAKWNRTLAMLKSDAQKACQDVEKGGRKAMIVEKGLSDRLGLPEGYDYETWKKQQTL
jgi:hypothetical protein